MKRLEMTKTTWNQALDGILSEGLSWQLYSIFSEVSMKISANTYGICKTLAQDSGFLAVIYGTAAFDVYNVTGDWSHNPATIKFARENFQRAHEKPEFSNRKPRELPMIPWFRRECESAARKIKAEALALVHSLPTGPGRNNIRQLIADPMYWIWDGACVVDISPKALATKINRVSQMYLTLSERKCLLKSILNLRDFAVCKSAIDQCELEVYDTDKPVPVTRASMRRSALHRATATRKAA
jgi:hypothetical protein